MLLNVKVNIELHSSLEVNEIIAEFNYVLKRLNYLNMSGHDSQVGTIQISEVEPRVVFKGVLNTNKERIY